MILPKIAEEVLAADRRVEDQPERDRVENTKGNAREVNPAVNPVVNQEVIPEKNPGETETKGLETLSRKSGNFLLISDSDSGPSASWP